MGQEQAHAADDGALDPCPSVHRRELHLEVNSRDEPTGGGRVAKRNWTGAFIPIRKMSSRFRHDHSWYGR